MTGAVVIGLTVVYLATLFFVGERAQRSERLSRWTRTPWVYALSLGAYASTWSYYGSVGFAARTGYVFLAVHLGVAVSCLAIPMVWGPLARLVRRHRLRSVADLLAFRFQSRAVGAVTTIFLVLASLPYVSLQLQAVVVTGSRLVPGTPPSWLGVAFAATLSVFAATAGARWSPAEGESRARRGLVASTALESVVKLVVLLVVAVVVVNAVFPGEGGVSTWIAEHPEVRAQMSEPVHDTVWLSVGASSFLAAFLLPRQFHLAFVERSTDDALRHARWTLPAYLLLMNLPLPLLVWAGYATLPDVRPDLWVLELGAREGLGPLVFVGGISAASAMVLNCCVALSGMVVNHLVVPMVGPGALPHLAMIRRSVIVTIVGCSFLLTVLMQHTSSLVELGSASFSAIAQLAPAVFATLFWTRATRRGALAGFAFGMGLWAVLTFGPWFGLHPELFGVATGTNAESFSVVLGTSLTANTVAFVVGSTWTPQRAIETAAADACVRSEVPGARIPTPADVEELHERLASALGADTADEVVAHTLRELDMDATERRPLALRQLTESVERNLAVRLGPLAAGTVVRGHRSATNPTLAAELQFASAEDDLVRRYLTGVLQAIPMAVAAVDASEEVILWNPSLEALTGLSQKATNGSRVRDLPSPWNDLLGERLESGPGQNEARTGASHSRAPRVLRLTCTRLHVLSRHGSGFVIVVEDLTERRAFLAELSHRERLSSLGRVAAGIAHEVLNPLTAIMMVAKNLERDARDETSLEDLELVPRLRALTEQSQRIERTVRGLLEFSRGRTDHPDPDPAPETLSALHLVTQATDLARLSAADHELDVHVDISESLRVRADRNQAVQILVNLVNNADDASDDDSPIVVSAEFTGPQRDRVAIHVMDRGVGIDAELAERVFEPFFTTKPSGRGTGLGLAVSHRLAQSMGGSLAWCPAPERGTVFTLELPAARPEETP